MSPLDPFRHAETVQFLRAHEATRLGKTETAIAAKAENSGSLDTVFEDLLDIVNPLQHLPVVGTLYRAITGDKMGTVEKIAGDTLYGGLWGAVGSLADTAFEAITGKDFGATMLAMVTNGPGESKPVQVAAAQPAKPQAAFAGAEELAVSMTAKGIDSALSARALYAYRRSQGMADEAAGLK